MDSPVALYAPGWLVRVGAATVTVYEPTARMFTAAGTPPTSSEPKTVPSVERARMPGVLRATEQRLRRVPLKVTSAAAAGVTRQVQQSSPSATTRIVSSPRKHATTLIL